MGMLAILIILLVLLLFSAWSSARSYFVKGRLAGMEEATLEIIRGINSHYQSAGQPVPDQATKAVAAIKSFARGASYEKSIYRYQARLWVFGDAAGAACWRGGYDACKQQMTVRDDRIRIDLSPDELLHLTSLAHLGFRKMMPNDRGIEMLRFAGEEQAREVTRVLEKLEWAVPEPQRPVEHTASRRALIGHWWPPERKIA
jgi:hypothetical protein